MLIFDFIKYLSAADVKSEDYRKFCASMVYSELDEIASTVSTVFQCYVYGIAEVQFDGRTYRVGEYSLPRILMNQLKFANIYFTTEGLFERNVKPLLTISCASEKFSNVVGMHPAKFAKLMEELTVYAKILEVGSPIEFTDAYATSVAEVGRLCTRQGDFKVTDSNTKVWICLFDDFNVESVFDQFCVKLPNLFDVSGGLYGIKNVVE